jgi:hypothetical protein
MARSDDTKLLCHAAQMIIALSGVSLRPLSGGKSLVLCQHRSQGIPRMLLSSTPWFSGILGKSGIPEPTDEG